MNIKVDLNEKLGKIKAMNGVGQPPIGGGMGYNLCSKFHYLSDVSVPYSRLHDVGGMFGGNRFVDVPNIFRDFDADENDPKNYDFKFTDLVVSSLVKAGVEPYYRLGVTIENSSEVESYRISPPKDYEKWARICEHIIAHYNEGWADGFEYNITYWEIWNEPDDGSYDGSKCSFMWTGSDEDYFRLYDVTAKHLKKRFPNIKIGGYAAIGFCALEGELEPLKDEPERFYHLDFFYDFLAYIKEHSSPIDFFSWHSYREPWRVVEEAFWYRKALDKFGFGNIESHLNEWNPVSINRGTGTVAPGTAEHAAQVAAIMLGSQNAPVDVLCVYDARYTIGGYSVFFTDNVYPIRPTHAYYSFAAFAALYNIGEQVKLDCDTDRVYAVAASNNGKSAIMIANVSGKKQALNIEGVDLTGARWHVLDDRRLLSWTPAVDTMDNNSVILIEF